MFYEYLIVAGFSIIIGIYIGFRLKKWDDKLNEDAERRSKLEN